MIVLFLFLRVIKQLNKVNICIKNDITISVCHIEQVKDILNCNLDGLKVHIKVNSGMNRLGISNLDEVLEVINLLDGKVLIEGIYSHIYDASCKEKYLDQLKLFESIVIGCNYSFSIIHIAASDALVNYTKPYFVNGCRLGIIMYGFNDKLELLSTFKVVSEVIQINTLNKGDVVGYNGIYTASNDGERIAVIPIGYADGIIRKNTGRYVYINDRKYRIIGNICMDMLFVKVDEDVKLFDKVEILRDNEHINDVSCHLETIPYEVMCSISRRVERVYILK